MRLIILEGPDCGGKSTLAEEILLGEPSAVLVHHGLYRHFTRQLPRLYVEAMLPALQGYDTVVMDRSWLSDDIYGAVYRHGQDRLGNASRRMLERIAMRCDVEVILCLPPVESCVQTFLERKGEEYLDDADQLRRVHALYEKRYAQGYLTDLPVRQYDYTANQYDRHRLRLEPHYHNIPSAGNLTAPVVIVGERFAERKDTDPLYQAPFVSFSGVGCSQWLTNQLDEAGVPESFLLWVNADVPSSALRSVINHRTRRLVCVLGQKAADAVRGNVHGPVESFRHPQAAKRFHHNETYDLIARIAEEYNR